MFALVCWGPPLFFSLDLVVRAMWGRWWVVVFGRGSYGLLEGNFDPANFKFVVVIPDIHGDLNSLLRSLYMAYELTESTAMISSYREFAAVVMDAVEKTRKRENHQTSKLPNFFSGLWSPISSIHPIVEGAENYGYITPLSSRGNEVLLVQLGDVVDRGPHSQSCLVLMRILDKLTGWKVAQLYGNHEIMSRLRRTSYIHPAEAKMIAKNSQSIWGRLSLARSYPGMGKNEPVWNRLTESALLVARLGILGEAEQYPAATLFVHGGIEFRFLEQFMNYPRRPSQFDKMNLVDRLNHLAQWMLSELSGREISAWLGSPGSPLWTRAFRERSSEFVCSTVLPQIQAEFQVARVIVGHTPTWNRRVRSMCDGQLIMADTGLSQWMFKDEPTANPTVLLMELDGRSLRRMDAYYFGEDQKVLRQGIFPIPNHDDQ